MNSNNRPVLHTLLGHYPNTAALRTGALQPQGFAFDFADYKVANRGFKRVVRDLAFDVAELALVTALQARAYGKPLVLLPAVVGAGRYQHHCLVYNREKGRLRLGELKGKRVGIRAHAQTTVTWVRGVLWDDYGIGLDDVQWVTFEDGHLGEFPDPPGVQRASGDQTAVEMLYAGELDAAIIGTDLPDDPRLAPVLPDPHVAAHAWAARNRLVPINHMVVVSEALFHDRPDLVRELYRLFWASKQQAPQPAPGQPDLTPFGVEANRNALEVLVRNAHDQRLIPKAYSIDELFADFNQLGLPDTMPSHTGDTP
jgi:4,5-dihydroxyphthalate decarboxylase